MKINLQTETSISREELFEVLKNEKSSGMIIGSGGCGKTYLLKAIRDFYRSKYGYDSVLIMAPTGCASRNAGGYTIQKLMSIGRHRIMRSNAKNADKLMEAKLLLIDEISMVSASMLDQMNDRLQQVRGNTLPFGGIEQVLMIGDPKQLQPVRDKDVPEDYLQENISFYNSEVFKTLITDDSFHFWKLTRNYRQKDDPVLHELLEKLRNNDGTSEYIPELRKICKVLNTRHCPKILYRNGAVYLCSSRAIASSINKVIMNLYYKGTTYSSRRKIVNDLEYEENESEENPYENLIDEEQIPNIVSFKIGSPIIFYRNDTENEVMRWTNGTQGKVIDVHWENHYLISVDIQIKNNDGSYGEVITVMRQQYQFDKKLLTKIEVKEKYERMGYIEQFPFMLSHAITIHKSQGMTLEKTVIVLDKQTKIQPCLMYVALSRSTRLEDIRIEGRVITPDCLKMNCGFEQFLEKHNIKIEYVD